MRICLYGAASPTIHREYIEKVEALGREMAKRGHSLVFGGGGNGLMGAAARGVHDGGGHIMGVIPKFFENETVEEIYEFCNELVWTDSMRQRKQIMEERSDAFIVTPGGIGTYEEFFEIYTLKQLGRHQKHIVMFNVDGFFDRLYDILKALVKDGFMRETCLDLLTFAATPDEVLAQLGQVSAAVDVTETKYV